MLTALLCSGASPDLAAQEQRARLEAPAGVKVHGEVVDDRSSDAVAGSRVVLVALPSRTPRLGPRATDDSGRFAFQEVPAGHYLLTVVAPAYGTMTDSVDVPATGDLRLVLRLSAESRSLDARVVASATPQAWRGFEARRRSGKGFIVTQEEIEASNAGHLTELLVPMPGARVVSTPPAGHTLLLRGDCRPGVWLNGARLRNAPPLDRITSLQTVGAVEVYHGFDLPASFGVDACGGVLIWTRTGPTPSGASADGAMADLIHRTALVAVLVALTVLVAR